MKRTVNVAPLILIGPSACGKSKLASELNKTDMFESLITYTTRPIREGEINGVDYHFLTEAEFRKMDLCNKFVESKKYNTLYNNVPATWRYASANITKSNKIPCIVLTPEGAVAWKNKYPDAVVVFVQASDSLRKGRAMTRGSFDDTEWTRRLASDKAMFKEDRLNRLIPDLVHFDNDNYADISTKVDDLISTYQATLYLRQADKQHMEMER